MKFKTLANSGVLRRAAGVAVEISRKKIPTFAIGINFLWRNRTTIL
jgi:hypothetical protein